MSGPVLLVYGQLYSGIVQINKAAFVSAVCSVFTLCCILKKYINIILKKKSVKAQSRYPWLGLLKITVFYYSFLLIWLFCEQKEDTKYCVINCCILRYWLLVSWQRDTCP